MDRYFRRLKENIIIGLIIGIVMVIVYFILK